MFTLTNLEKEVFLTYPKKLQCNTRNNQTVDVYTGKSIG